jgi:outer membrane protein assembly factor BamE (lipoprotein component of BamABCDE complex)
MATDAFRSRLICGLGGPVRTHIKIAFCALLPLVSSACMAPPDMGKDFDETKVSEIRIGATTKSQVQSLLGAPVNRLSMDGRETWTYQRVTTSNSGAGTYAATQGAMTVASIAGSMIPGVGALGMMAGALAATSAGGMAASQSKITSNAKTLTIEFRQDIVLTCRLMISRTNAEPMTAAVAPSDTEITTCGAPPNLSLR